jgi:thiazole synthase
MKVRINGNERDIQANSVSELVDSLGLSEGRIALERNLEIVPRANWQHTTITDGDRFEIVHFVGGG